MTSKQDLTSEESGGIDAAMPDQFTALIFLLLIEMFSFIYFQFLGRVAECSC